ncbi:serine/threonine-protein kinase [Undibacterium sp. TS12]|uniref:serine/threonine protein kinase n=1 Tax=Undibacterium sp. TS12 TaxID=2908202 RepID=UPI001F4D1797|nr:serine/threonine-protein kinase [Undibacterium sp. TS12]MCH8618932.1 serine/threonine protein kinase [Undibacterium sp. TS12]
MQNNFLSTPAAPSAALPNKRVGRFYLSERIGMGSNGAVYLGHDPVIDRDVAIKIFSAGNNAADKKQREQQFINEARAAGRLSHPNIVTIFDASSEGGTTFIAMEFLQGKDLRHLLADGKQFDIIETTNLIKKVADALAYAHTNGVIHRDIKPGNIFVLPNQQPKVVDFGIARAPNRVLDETREQAHTLFNNNIMGTPNYMSPEQANGKQVNALTDVYSLGAVMYEMLTGQKPFQSQDVDKLLQQIVNKTPKNPSEVRPGIPDSLSKIVMKAMQKEPSARYESAAEMALALEKFLDRDKKLKRKRQKQGESYSSERNTDDEHRNSWISWLALILAIVAVTVYVMHRL